MVWTGHCNYLERAKMSPGLVAQLLRASSQYTKDEGSIPGQGTYKNQSMDA